MSTTKTHFLNISALKEIFQHHIIRLNISVYHT